MHTSVEVSELRSMMLQPEHILVPFSVSELPPGPWLVFAPHSDDETFGMGGSLLKAFVRELKLMS